MTYHTTIRLTALLTWILTAAPGWVDGQVAEKWLQLGTGAPKNQTLLPSMVFDRNGNLYLAYTDQTSPGNKATVKKFDGQTWTTIGSQFTPGEALFVKIDVDSADVPYIAFQEPLSLTKKLTVMKYNGTAWDTVGQRGFATADFGNPELDFSINRTYNMPVVVFRENASGKASLMMFNGQSWNYSGGPGFTPGDATKMSLSCQGNASYVAFRNGVKGNLLSVMTDQGGGWSFFGDTVLSDGIPDYINCYRTLGYTNDQIVVAFKDADGKAYLKRKIGNQWLKENGTAISEGNANYITLLRRRGSTLPTHFVIGYADGSESGNATVKRSSINNPAGYEVIGKKAFTDTLGIFASAYYATMGIDRNDSLYIAVQSFNEYVVFKYRASVLNNVGLGAERLLDISGVTVYPNPSATQVTIRSNSSDPFRNVSLFSIDGKVIRKTAFHSEQKEYTFDLSDQPDGFYFVEAVLDSATVRTRLIKITE